ncbi:MAG: hypothetical protein J0H15_12950 [Xanthomonadales bacterium]|nr:hypothetical protein [Xanthomonadales bacterium]
MTRPAPAAPRPSLPPEDPATPPGAFERLRELLLGSEARELANARARIAALEEAQRALPERLPAALAAAPDADHAGRLAAALAAPVSAALGTAVRTQPKLLVDGLFPVIGPLIRKSIAEALRSFVADLNSAIESSLTPRGLRWRIEAWRAGVPYAQVVLRHRLACSIDHVFLIERESGRVLWHAAAPELAALDGDAIAGMLTALGEFVQDSVGKTSGGGLESASVGEHLVWVVAGPAANLACFMRGAPPPQLRERLQQRLEEIHLHLGEPGGNGPDASSWAAGLEPGGLLSAADAALPAGRARLWPWLVLILVACAALGLWVVRDVRWNARVAELQAALATHPGFLPLGIETKSWRALTIRGMIDRDAPPLEAVLARADLGKVTPKLEFGRYVSGDDAIVAARARRLLAPPAGVGIAVADGVLSVTGSAPAGWVAAARERAPLIAGVADVDFRLAERLDRAAALQALQRLAARAAELQVPFAEEAEPAADAAAVLAAIVAVAREAAALAETAGVTLVLQSVGSNDESGGEAINAQVRALRARWLADALAAEGIPGVEPVAGDPGSRRSAWLRIRIEPAP